jgi:DinB superfamily
MRETAQQYTERILKFSEGRDGLELQQSMPQKLAGLLEGKTQEELTRRPDPEKWSVAEILAHLGDAEIAISWRMRQILGSNGVKVQAFDQEAWAKAFGYANRDPRESLEFFRVVRGRNLALLRSIPGELWDNYGMHEERGKESIRHMVKLTAGHDLNHLRQIEAILNEKS